MTAEKQAGLIPPGPDEPGSSLVGSGEVTREPPDFPAADRPRSGESPGPRPRLIVSGLSKTFCRERGRALRYGAADLVRELAPFGWRQGLRPGEFQALDNVSFTLGEGEALAIIGHNGAGKSSLLKILSGLLKPDQGEVRIRGTVGAMIELGTGLNPLLSGGENIRLGAALAGFSGKDERRLVDEVLDFSELAPFIDAPFQTYSSGMKARLAYALAAHIRSDILLVDEVLAVGDYRFQQKCLAHMRAYLDQGGSLIFVSHNVFEIQSVCQRGLLLEKGRVIFDGSAVESLTRMFESRPAPSLERQQAVENKAAVTIDAIRAEGLDGGAVETGKPLRLTLDYSAREPAKIVWGFGIWSADQWVCITSNHNLCSRTLEAGKGELNCIVPRLPLVAGRYCLRCWISDPWTRYPLALHGWEDAASTLEVRGPPDRITNEQMGLGQLVTIDVEWT